MSTPNPNPLIGVRTSQEIVTVSSATAVFTSVYVLDTNIASALYEVVVSVELADAANYIVSYYVSQQGATITLNQFVTSAGGLLLLANTGLVLQVRQNSGATKNVKFSIVRLQ